MKRLAVLALLLISACGGPPGGFGRGPVVVETAPLTVGTIEDSSDFIATLNSRQSVTLKPRVTGQVSQILVKPGDRVGAKTPLLLIDPSQQVATVQSNEAQVATAKAEIASREAALQSARAGYESAKALLSAREADRLQRVSALNLQRRDAQRDRELFSAGVISQRVLEVRINNLEGAEAALQSLDREIKAQEAKVAEAEARIAQAEAELDGARQRLQQFQSNTLREQVQLEFHQISAPFDGLVGTIPVKVGDFVNSATELLTLTQSDQLEVEIAIPVDRASQLKEGLAVKILDEQNKIVGDGTIFFISPTVNPQSQSVLVKAVFDNKDGKLRQDQLVRVRLVWDSRPGLKVPVTAVSRQAGKTFVYVIETDTTEGTTKTIAKQKRIEVGKIIQNQQEVLSGLQPKETVVVSGIQFLRDGAEVKTQKDRP
ncbi:MAG: efflux transporter periplasmic adaptor subunit [Cyanobacteria bacterium M5B4]|nr:MAG: efflux transporter periplasmic adaptor subunit [Cyanobacteria bacterium M5B4]